MQDSSEQLHPALERTIGEAHGVAAARRLFQHAGWSWHQADNTRGGCCCQACIHGESHNCRELVQCQRYTRQKQEASRVQQQLLREFFYYDCRGLPRASKVERNLPSTSRENYSGYSSRSVDWAAGDVVRDLQQTCRLNMGTERRPVCTI